MLKPYPWKPTSYIGLVKAKVEYYISMKKAWEERVSGLEGIWEINPSDVIAGSNLIIISTMANTAGYVCKVNLLDCSDFSSYHLAA